MSVQFLNSIPDNWKIVKLSDVAEVKGRIGFRGYTRNDIVEKGKGAITTSPSNIINNKIDFGNCTYISWFKYDESPEIQLRLDDILLVKTGSSFGKSAIIKHLPQKATINPQLVVIKVNNCNSDYLFYNIIDNNIQQQIKSTIVGGAIPTLSQKNILEFTFPLPPKEEQQKIAEILTTVDDKIELIDQQIEQTQELKKGLMQKHLTGEYKIEEGIIVKRNETFKDSELGKIPESWEVGKVDSFLLKKKGAIKIGPFGSQLKKDTFVEYGIKVYGQENIFKNDMSFGDRFISDEHYNRLKTCELFSGDFIISMMGTIGKCMVVPDGIEKGIMDSHLLRLQLNKELMNSDYLSQLFSSPLILNQVDNLAVGGIMAGLSSNIVKQINFTIPPIKEQLEIATFLNKVDEKKGILESKKSEYTELKKGLMQKLLTGKIRVKV